MPDEMERDFERVDEIFSHQTFNAKLAAVRAKQAFVEILPFPDKILGYALSQDTPLDINLPQGAKFIRFKGDCNYFVGKTGNAQVPSAGLNGQPDLQGAVYKPEDFCFFVGEVLSLSVITHDAAGGHVTVLVWTQEG